MYKVITSLWSKPIVSNKTSLPGNASIDDDSWVFVADTVMVSSTFKVNHQTMTNSWIASPPLPKTDEPSTEVHHLNPLENLLIEHASMSVYEQIPSKSRSRRPRKLLDHQTLDEGVEDDDDDEEEGSMNQRGASIISTHPRTVNLSLNSSTATLESSTSSLTAHHRHLHRLQQQRRKRSKLLVVNNTDEFKQVISKNLDRSRFNHLRTPKILLPQPSRANQ